VAFLPWRRFVTLLLPFAGCFGTYSAPDKQPPAPVVSSTATTIADGGDAASATAVVAGAPANPGPAATEDPPPPAKLAPELRLPWTAGESWILTSGPHSHNRAALDFAPPNINPRTKRRFTDPCSRQRGNARWVRAAAAGRVTSVLRAGCPLVQIEHDDGTTTNYFHLRRGSVKALGLAVGDLVQAGQILGHPSCETGPKVCGATHAPSGVHVHFYRTLAATGARLPADGLVLSGWKVHAARRVREGTMTKGDEIRAAQVVGLTQTCAAARVGSCGHRSDLESDNEPPSQPPVGISLNRAVPAGPQAQPARLR
jgi:hypothetical protein